MGDQEANSGDEVKCTTEVNTLKTKAFFTEPLDRATHREVVHKKVQELITKEDDRDTAEIIHLGQCGWEAVGQVVSPTYFAMALCRKFNILASERCVLLPLRDQYQAIQLCLAKINKKKHGDFEAPVSDVLDVWNELYRETVTCDETTKSLMLAQSDDDDCKELNLPSSRRESYDPVVREMQDIVKDYQEFMQSSGCIDHFSVFATLKEHLTNNKDITEYISSKVYIIEGLSQMPTMERELLKLLLSDAQILKLSLALPSVNNKSFCDFDMSGIGEDALNTSQVVVDSEAAADCATPAANDSVPSVLTEDLDSTLNEYIEEIPKSPGTTDFSESELYVEQLILAHIRLLINTRDELALAALCSMPGREITQQGFYQIKDEAQKKNMPMYPTILSFVMRLRLGGNVYQAYQDCPILLYSKPLGEFVDSIMKLQNIVEEEPNPRKGAMKVLSSIKSGLLRIRGRALKGACIEKVWDSLYSAFVRLANIPEEEAAKKTVVSKIQQTTGALRPCLKLLVELCDEASGRITEEIVDVLGENFLTQCNSSKKTATPIRIPTVLSLFRSPVRGSSTSKLKNLDDECEDSLRMRLMKSKGLTPKNVAAPRFKSGCAWAPDDLSPVRKGNRSLDSTLSPIIGPTLKAVGNSSKRSSQDWKEIVNSVSQEEEVRRKESELSPSKHKSSKTTKAAKTMEEKRSKRSLLSDISNIAVDSSHKKSKSSGTTKKSPTKKKSKTQPILKGQKSITSFFKV